MAFFKMAVVVLGLLALTQQSMQLSFESHRLRMLGSGIIKADGIRYGLLATSLSAEKALNNSGLFVPSSSVNLFGRTFISGTIYGLNIVYVRSASTPSVHVGMTVQILVDNFNIDGIIHYGSAGTTNETISIGDVVVPKRFFFTGAWEWLSKDSNTKGQLNIGDFNYPVNGENLLGSLLYAETLDMYSFGRQLEVANDIVVSTWTNLAILIDIQIPGYKVFHGLNASSSDIYVSNPAYRKFLYKHFRASTVDTAGAAFMLATYSTSQVFNIVFQGISNKAGAGSAGESNSTLANENAFSAAAQFIKYYAYPPTVHRV